MNDSKSLDGDERMKERDSPQSFAPFRHLLRGIGRNLIAYELVVIVAERKSFHMIRLLVLGRRAAVQLECVWTTATLVGPDRAIEQISQAR